MFDVYQVSRTRIVFLYALASVASWTGCAPASPTASAASLQGDWTPVWDETNFIQYRAASFRGDSARLHLGPPKWAPFSIRSESLHIHNVDPLAISVSGDTLELTGESSGGDPFTQRFVRLRTSPNAPRPERIALSAGYCYGFCPSFDIEVDSTGSVRYHGRSEVEYVGDHVAEGRRALFERLSETAAAVRADTSRRTFQVHDDHELALLVWYGGEVRVHHGTEIGFGPLNSLIVELFSVAGTIPLNPAPHPLTFEGREYIYTR